MISNTAHLKLLFIGFNLWASGIAFGQSYSLDMFNTEYAVIEQNGSVQESVASLGMDILSGSSQLFLGGTFPEISLRCNHNCPGEYKPRSSTRLSSPFVKYCIVLLS